MGFRAQKGRCPGLQIIPKECTLACCWLLNTIYIGYFKVLTIFSSVPLPINNYQLFMFYQHLSSTIGVLLPRRGSLSICLISLWIIAATHFWCCGYNRMRGEDESRWEMVTVGIIISQCILCTYWLSRRAGRENIWPEVMAYRPSAARSVRHDRGPNIFPSGPT